MLGLALGQSNFAFDLARLPVQVQRHQGVALLFHLDDHFLDLLLVQQQFFGAHLVGADVGGGRIQRVDLAADQKQLARAHHHVAVGELHLAFAQRLDLPAFQHQAALDALLEEVVKSGLFVVGNAGGRIGFFGH